jgi:sigma-B regulation protein RsbU (phosphoserine phosphatase)
MFYLIDVSGHGVEPALLSVSVHNLLRSGSLPDATLLEPDQVLAELNDLFSMDSHADHYFTMWFGVYQLSTGELRYASAGHPPALAFVREGDTVSATPLGGGSIPVGMFDDSVFTVESYRVPPGTRILLYSDGVLGDPPQMAEFVALCTELAAEPSSSLDDILSSLPLTTEDQGEEDDRSLVQLTFSR